MKVGDSEWEWARVFLDGVYQKQCIYADEEEGYVIRVKLDSDGRLMFNPLFIENEYGTHPSENELVKEKVFGKVEIET